MAAAITVAGKAAWSETRGGEDIVGQVVGVTDGDTLTLLTPDKRQVKIRLAEIDTPERGQPFGTQAKQALACLTFHKDVTVRYTDTDRYGRIVGRVFVDGTDVNAALVSQGFAWVYRKYATDLSLYELEKDARASRRGLWAGAGPVPPWEWRRGARTPSEATPRPRTGNARSPAGFTCGAKRYCREMMSCEEAMYYLRQCGLRRLDGDGDGVPCEAICR